MIALLGTVLSQARTLLNDDDAASWPDVRLIPKAQQAFNQMQADLLIAGIPIINTVSAIMTVPAMTTDDSNVDLSANASYPTDMIMPIWLKERQTGQHNTDFVDMLEVDFIPQVDISAQLLYWCWQKQTILLRGALVSNQVQLRYQRLLVLPTLNTDSTQVILSELYLSYKTAALAAFSAQNYDLFTRLDAISTGNLYKIVQMGVKQLQNTPTKRRAYHRGSGRNGIIRSL